jgi:hypothetical protein
MGLDCDLSCIAKCREVQPLSLFKLTKKKVFEAIITGASKGAYPCEEERYWANTPPYILEMCKKWFYDYGEEAEVYRPMYGPLVDEMDGFEKLKKREGTEDLVELGWKLEEEEDWERLEEVEVLKKLDLLEQFPMGRKVELWDSRAGSFCPDAVPNVPDTLHHCCANSNPNVWEYEVQNEEDCEYINDWFIELSKQSNYDTLYYLPPSWTGVLHFECVLS